MGLAPAGRMREGVMKADPHRFTDGCTTSTSGDLLSRETMSNRWWEGNKRAAFMTSLKYEDVVLEILETVKGIPFDPDFDDYELAFVVVEDYLMNHLVSDAASPEDVQAGFELIGRMVESEDRDVRGLLDVGIVEWLEAWLQMGKHVEIARFLSRTPPALDAALHRQFPERWPQLLAEARSKPAQSVCRILPDRLSEEVLRRGCEDYRAAPMALEYFYFEVPARLMVGDVCLTDLADGEPVELPAVFWACALPRATAQCVYEGHAEIDLGTAGAGGDNLYFHRIDDNIYLSGEAATVRVRATVALEVLRAEAIRVSENIRKQLLEALPELLEHPDYANWMKNGPDLWFRDGPAIFGWKNRTGT